MKIEPQKEHQWLQQLAGEWTYESEAACVSRASRPRSTNFGLERGLTVFHAFKRATDIASGLIAEGYHSTYAVVKVPR